MNPGIGKMPRADAQDEKYVIRKRTSHSEADLRREIEISSASRNALICDKRSRAAINKKRNVLEFQDVVASQQVEAPS
jgi:hypothetical protein